MVFAAESDTEDEPARGELRDRRDLPRHGHWMPETEQVHRGLHLHRRRERRERGRLEQPVETLAAVEADVIAHAQVIEAGRLRRATLVRSARASCSKSW